MPSGDEKKSSVGKQSKRTLPHKKDISTNIWKSFIKSFFEVVWCMDMNHGFRGEGGRQESRRLEATEMWFSRRLTKNYYWRGVKRKFCTELR